MAKVNLETRLLAKIDKHGPLWNGTPCWNWKGCNKQGGYGQIHVRWVPGHGSRQRLAHVVAYELFVRPMPTGLELDHLCRNHGCVNPEHLEAVTHKENTRRGDGGKISGARLRARTHCRKGHPYDTENTYIHITNGSRVCRKCVAASTRLWRQRRSETV